MNANKEILFLERFLSFLQNSIIYFNYANGIGYNIHLQ